MPAVTLERVSFQYNGMSKPIEYEVTTGAYFHVLRLGESMATKFRA